MSTLDLGARLSVLKIEMRRPGLLSHRYVRLPGNYLGMDLETRTHHYIFACTPCDSPTLGRREYRRLIPRAENLMLVKKKFG